MQTQLHTPQVLLLSAPTLLPVRLKQQHLEWPGRVLHLEMQALPQHVRGYALLLTLARCLQRERSAVALLHGSAAMLLQGSAAALLQGSAVALLQGSAVGSWARVGQLLWGTRIHCLPDRR